MRALVSTSLDIGLATRAFDADSDGGLREVLMLEEFFGVEPLALIGIG